MEQFEVVFKHVKGFKHVVTKTKNGDLIVRLVPEATVENGKSQEEQFFTRIGEEERKKVKKWLAQQKGQTTIEKTFLKVLKKAIEEIDYEYWISNTEPSVKNNKIYYGEGYQAGIMYANNQWKDMAEEYCPKRGSRLSSLCELFIWYALRIVDNTDSTWTLDKVSNYSTRVFSTDAQVSTIKFVSHNGGYVLVGGNSRSGSSPVEVFVAESPYSMHVDTTAVVVLTK